MSNDILTSLLSDYEQKKRKAEVEFEHQKTELYKKIPRLHEIEDELNSVAINETKNILLGNSSSLENLHQKIESLRKKEKIFYLKIIFQQMIYNPNMNVVYVKILDI